MTEQPFAALTGRYRPYHSLTVEEQAERDWFRGIASLRYGVLDGMRMIRTQLMRPGEWDDPGIPEMDFLNEAILDCGSMSSSFNHVERARYEVALRWTLKKERQAREDLAAWKEAA